jgi:hypothetical protein
MLSASDAYSGGGTYIRALKKTIRLEQGQCLVHPGNLFHKGVDISEGQRYMLVRFMNGFDPKIAHFDMDGNQNFSAFEGNVVSFEKS